MLDKMDQNTAAALRSKRKSIAHQPTGGGTDNATTDVAALQRADKIQAIKKKSRGKSIGPGGLEALKETSGNATKVLEFRSACEAQLTHLQADPTLQIRSILKPTVPLTPPKVIPSFDELRQRSTRKRSPAKSGAEELLIDFSTPAPSRDVLLEVPVTGAEKVMDPFSPTKSPVGNRKPMVEENKEAEAKHRAQKQAALDRRAERRKSMANRRVSFAPEATLHTWSVMELAEDSTTSSASNSTRRQSSMTQTTPKAPTAPASEAPDSDRAATPEDQTGELQVAASPAHQRDLHQKKRRRSSTAPTAQLEGSMEEVFSSSPSGDVTTESSPVRIDDSAGSDTDDDTDGDTAMSMDEPTSQSLDSENSTSSRTSLDDRLRQAASQAGTRGIDYDEQGEDLSMEMATSTVTNAFQPWTQKAGSAVINNEREDQENMIPFSPASKAKEVDTLSRLPRDADQEDTQDMSMDVTNAVGSILQKGQTEQRRKSMANRRRNSMPRRQSSATDAGSDDDSMDFTAVGGQILSKHQNYESDDASEEEMTMEFTNVVGGVLGRQQNDDSLVSQGNEETMDLTGNMELTTAYGGILPPIEEQTEPQTDAEDTQTAAMDMTRAVGRIVPGSSLREQASAGTNSVPESRDMQKMGTPQRQNQQSRGFVSSIASETGSPDITLKPRLSARSRQYSGPSTTPKFSPKRPSPAKSSPSKAKAATPTKQMTPLPSRIGTPNKTPISVKVGKPAASPKRLFTDEIKARQSPASAGKASAGKTGLFSHNTETGQALPSVVLQAARPQLGRRRSSGIGIDQEGFGSPRVAEMLNRRSSIVESAPEFKFDKRQKSRLRFEDPQEMAREVDAERMEDERRESGRFIMEQEANGFQETSNTMNLSQMIDSMTPKKEPKSRLNGRKSLAVGAARGLLGKRPAELDVDDEDSPSSPKRLRGVSRESSPVKKVHLPKPPSKEDITGRLTRAAQKQLQGLSGFVSTTPAASPPKKTAASPHLSSRFKDIPVDQSTERPESFVDKMDNVLDAVDMSIAQEQEAAKDNVSLQEFLNMTNIHFIELSTTKRRHTQAPVPQRPSQEHADKSTEAQFVSASTTLPLIELYQHATRELKRNISDGRKVIRSIETEILHDQPALFREYVDARPDIRTVMDNQFRNGKTNARLQSKEIWYTWRGQLVTGLRSGLVDIGKGLHGDAKLLDAWQADLDTIVPALQNEQATLSGELGSLQRLHEDLDSVDVDALDQTRKDLRAADAELSRKSALLESLKQQMQEKEEALESAEEFKAEMTAQIEEADRVRQEFRGWPVADVLELRSRVDKIEKESGWKLIAAEEDVEEPNDFGVALTMVFRDKLRLFFYPAAFQTSSSQGRRRSGRKSKSVSGPTAPISLTYAPMTPEGDFISGTEPSTQNRFFLQMIRSQLHTFSMMPRRSVAPKTILDTVSRGWDLATQISEEIRLLNTTGITTVQILGDEKLGARTKLMFAKGSRIDVEFALSVTILSDGEIASSTMVSATGIYGLKSSLLSGSKGRKVQLALTKEVESKELGTGAWTGAIHAFEQWIEGQAEKQHEKQEGKQQQPQPKQVPLVERRSETVVEERQDNGHDSKDDFAPPPQSMRDLRRSPLAPKSKNVPAQKKIPVASKRFALASSKLQHQLATSTQDLTTASDAVGVGKENLQPTSLASATKLHAITATPTKQLQRAMGDAVVDAMDIDQGGNGVPGDVDFVGKSAIPPAMQEELMTFGSPFKRRGALRRSPV